MAIQIVETKMLATLSQERIVLMNAFGAEHQLYIPFSKAAERDTIISDAQTQLQAVEDQSRAYILEHSGQATLDQLLAKGAEIIAARKASQQ